MTIPDPAEPNSTQAPAVVVLVQRTRARWPVVVGVVVLLALLGTGAAYTAINLPHGCGVFAVTRHGLPCDVPLPAGATYERPFSLPGGAPSGATEQGWAFSVPHTSGRALHDFYAVQLAANGWRCVHDSTTGLPIDNPVFATFSGGKDARTLIVTYNGNTGEMVIDVLELHAPIGAC